MKIYNTNSLSNSFNYILDPDYQHFDASLEKNLYYYFKQLSIPQSVIYIVGIYIQFEIGELLYENDPFIYQKFSYHVQNKIESYLDFGNAHLLNTNSNIFFLTMFDVIEDNLVSACLQLNQDLNKRQFQQQMLNIRTGIYFSRPTIAPFQFYYMAKEQFENTLIHDQTLISVKSLSMVK